MAHIIPVLFAVGSIVSWDFVLQYGFRAKWYSHVYGRINLGFMITVALIMSFVVVNSYVKDYFGRDVIRYVLYATLVSVLITLDVFLHLQLRKRGPKR